MGENVYELVTKMYNEFTAKLEVINTKLDGKADKEDITRIEENIIHIEDDIIGIKGKITGMEDKITGMEDNITSIKKDIIRLENKFDAHSKVLFDGYKQTYEKLVLIEKKVDGISEKVEKQEVEIKVLKSR
jgi:predicted  nucleic acid-binding Zn-ribbon protein